MDTLTIAAHWPKHPYRGLDFYREADALLFRARDKDVVECTTILLGYGVKILLLQGSSGSGKSSFLRAGLIPRLELEERRRNIFLGGRDRVIRCTSDPLPEIARALVGDLANCASSVATIEVDGGGWGADILADSAICRRLRQDIEQSLSGPRERLGDTLVEAFVEICGELSGKLILILDQAEEVLTQTPGGRAEGEGAAAFFRFLEDVYVRNIDMRVVVALRTEYYGRFRDELRISDSRLSKRPRSGGIEPYLLWPLRDRAALLGIIAAPTEARRDDGISVYDFAFEPGLPERIVDDLLETFPHGSVTPALQVVCAALHERLTDRNRTISCAQYARLGGIHGITQDYLGRGLAAAGARTKRQRDQWAALLFYLVSRQGGGTLVSLTRPLEELESKARSLGIRGHIEAALARLTRGATPLLRGEPPGFPRNFSLKHDVLAVPLARWSAAREGAAAAKKQAIRWAFSIGLAALVIVVGLGALLVQHAKDEFDAKTQVIEVRHEHAVTASDGNFRRSLLLELANLGATAAPDDIYERLTGGVERKHVEILGELRKLLLRAPAFAGYYQAAGFDPAGDRLALLPQGEGRLWVVTLPTADTKWLEPQSYDLPAAPGKTAMSRSAAGFLRSLGPAALVKDHVYFWNEAGQRQDCDIGPMLPTSFKSASWIRGEFIAGRLQLSVIERQVSLTERQGPTSSLRVLRLDTSDLRECSSRIAAKEPLRLLGRAGLQPAPAFSDAEDLPQSYDYLEETSEPAPDELAPNLPFEPSRRLVELDAVIGSAERQDLPVRVAVGLVSVDRVGPERPHYTTTFAANAPAAVIKFDGPDFYIYDLANGRAGKRLGYLDITPQHVAVSTEPYSADDVGRLQPARVPWAYPPLAAVKVGQHWRAAWLAPNGVWAVESSDLDPGTATPTLLAPLIAEPDGAKLQFSRSGQFLVLQRVQFPSQVFVRVWDLRPDWKAWIENSNTTEAELRAAACRVVRMETSSGAFDAMAAKLFRIDAAHREPCPEAEGAGP